MFVEIVKGTQVVLTTIKHRKSILEAVKYLSRLIAKGKWKVPIFGDGGTGKSTLGTLLQGQLDLTNPVPVYRSSIRREERRLPGEIPCIFLVAPGQKRFRERTDEWTELFRVVTAAKSAAIINVVSYGYHSTELEYGAHDIYKTGMSEAEYLRAYLAYNQAGELDALRLLLPHAMAVKAKLWMITLVTKQDLWWNDRHDVAKYYIDEEKDYGRMIKALRNKLGAKSFKHEYFSASLISENLTSGDRKLIAPTCAGYDHHLRIANLNNFLTGLKDLLG